MVPISIRSLSSRKRSASKSITVMSFFSLERFSATAEPTCPAPKIIIFTVVLVVMACEDGLSKSHHVALLAAIIALLLMRPLGCTVWAYLPVPLDAGPGTDEFDVRFLVLK